MTEAEWNSCTDLWRLLDRTGYLRGKASERKLRLLAVACCRRLWNPPTNPRSRRAVEVAELYAEGAGRAQHSRIGVAVSSGACPCAPAFCRPRHAPSNGQGQCPRKPRSEVALVAV
jgi:hypothetical protein